MPPWAHNHRFKQRAGSQGGLLWAVLIEALAHELEDPLAAHALRGAGAGVHDAATGRRPSFCTQVTLLSMALQPWTHSLLSGLVLTLDQAHMQYDLTHAATVTLHWCVAFAA